MNIWIVSREYAGIAEAGGVKNVACSLSESLVSLGHKVTLFIPLYACTDLSLVKNYSCLWHEPVKFKISQTVQSFAYSHGVMNGVDFVFIGHKKFSEKKGVYTYTREDELENANHIHGHGHEDVNFLNTIFQKAVVCYGETCKKEDAPDIIHCQDATAALVPTYMHYKMQIDLQAKSFFSKTKCFVTIHNAGPGYHHSFANVDEAIYYTALPASILSEGICNRKVEPFLLAAKDSVLTTVSPEYANEILSGKVDTDGLSEMFRERNVKIYGITNGIDYSRYDPADTKKSSLPFAFNPIQKNFDGKFKCREYLLNKYCYKQGLHSETISVEENLTSFGHLNPSAEKCVYFVFHGRVVVQKGLDVLIDACKIVLEKSIPAKFILFGQGDVKIEEKLSLLTKDFNGSVVYLRGYSKELSRLCIASADFSLHPSYFEPCGLEDFIAQIYGTIPVAHATGGLCKIVNEKTGFLYKPNEANILSELIEKLCNDYLSNQEKYLNLASYASLYVKENYNWKLITENKYLKLYKNEEV